MMKKKVMSILLTTAVMVSMLAGCGSDAADEGSGESADRIIIFQSKAEIAEQLEAMAEDYEKETGVEVEIWGSTGDDYFQQLKTKLANNQGPTVFSLGPGGEAEQIASYQADLSDLSFIDKIEGGMAYTRDEKVYGVPFTAEGIGLIYNKELYDPSEITDTDSLINFLEEQKSDGIDGLELSSESFFLIGHALNAPFALQDDPVDFLNKFSKGEVKLADTKEFQEFADLYVAIRENSTNPLNLMYDKIIGNFANGKTAMIHQGNWAASVLADYENNFDYDIAPLPIAGNDKLAVSVPTAWFVNSQASPEEQQAGKDFLNWLYTSEKGIDYLMNQFGFIPVVEGMTNDNLDPLSQTISQYIAEGRTIPWSMNEWPAGAVDVYLAPVAEDFFTSDMSANEFLTELDNAFAESYGN